VTSKEVLDRQRVAAIEMRKAQVAVDAEMYKIQLEAHMAAFPPVSDYSVGDSVSYTMVKPKATKGLPKTRAGKDIVYLVDADTHAYRAAAATDGSHWYVSGWQSLSMTKYKKEVVQWAKDKGLPNPVYEQGYNPEPERHALKILGTSLEIFDDRKVEYFVTGKSNFRYDIIKNYKGNRAGRRPANLPVCKQELLNRGAVLNENLEADDLVIIRAKELDKLGIPWTIVGCDKDLLQIEGHFYDPFKREAQKVSKGEARNNLWKQIATGDSTDNIKSPRGLGPKSFDKAFKCYDWEEGTDFEALILMVNLYKTKAKQKDGEDDDEYTERILRWIKTVASLVFLRRGENEEYQLPTKDGKINRDRTVYKAVLR